MGSCVRLSLTVNLCWASIPIDMMASRMVKMVFFIMIP